MSRINWSNEKLFERLLTNQSTRTYWDNVKTLCTRPEKAVFKRCSALVKSKLPRERRIGIDVLSQLGGEERPFQKQTLALYIRILPKESDVKVLESLLHAIGHNNKELDDKGIDKLSYLKKHRYAVVRYGVIHALQGVDRPAAIDMLIELSTDKDTDVRDWATFSIGSMITRNNKAIRDALWARVNDTDEDTRMEAVMGLASRKDPGIYEIIRRELSTGEIGTLLFDAIAALGGQEFLSPLKKLHKQSANDHTIHPQWLSKLEDAIEELSA